MRFARLFSGHLHLKKRRFGFYGVIQTEMREIVLMAVDWIAKWWGNGQAERANRLIRVD